MNKRIIALGPADALPRGLVQDLAAEMQVDRSLSMDVHYMHGTPNLQPMEDAARRGQVTLYCYFAAGFDRQLMARGVPIQFVPCAFRDIGAAMLAAGVTDLYHAGRSWDGVDISFGSCCGYAHHLLAVGQVRLHLEDNINLPRTGPMFDTEAAGIDTEITWRDEPVHLHRAARVTDTDRHIAKHILAVMPHAPVIQVGVGGVPNSVLAMMVEHRMPVRRIVSELFSPAMIPLIESGLLIEDVECTVAFGDTPAFYEFIERTGHRIHIRPVEHTNNSERLSQIDGLVSINSCLEVDLTGQVNSEEVNRRPYSGSGGQLDFVLGATRSKGGMSFLCMPSKRVDKVSGSIRSRIVERLHGAVTVPRNCVDWIVTERGAVRLRGLSADARRDALLGIA